MEKQRVIVITGPTASGKTGLSIELAKRFNGAVISADSRQVYKGLDIGTEKVTKREMRGVPHYCIDIASPKRAFSVEQWRTYAQKAMRAIYKQGKIPIIVGGTGFYIDSLVYGTTFPTVKPNPILRKRLEKMNADELLYELTLLDPERAKTVEQKNPRRLIRAIEIAQELGHVPPHHIKETPYEVTWIGINPGEEVLLERIRSRLDTTVRKGLIREVQKLIDEVGLSKKRIFELGLEYRIAYRYLNGELSKAEMKEVMVRELRKYAKRQMTWLKRNQYIRWFKNAGDALETYTSL